ncbi:MAG: ESX secretion-associated protein EspG [Pseudonocardiaceae bacterium]
MTDPQWALLAGDLGHDSYPAPLRVGVLRGPGAYARARDELRAAGLLRAGRVDADLEDALRLLHRPAIWFDSLWLPEAGSDALARVVVASSGIIGVSATQHPAQSGVTAIEVIGGAGLAAAVVGRLPTERPGRRPAVTVPVDPAAAHDDDGQDSGSVLVSSTDRGHSPARDHAIAAAILDAPHPRAGQISANVRDFTGTVHRSAVLRWYDNEADGRYQVELSWCGDRLEISPADPKRLGDAIQRLLPAPARR